MKTPDTRGARRWAAGLGARARTLWGRSRTTVLSVGGFACVTVSAGMVAVPLGWLVAGASLFALEALGGKGGSP